MASTFKYGLETCSIDELERVIGEMIPIFDARVPIANINDTHIYLDKYRGEFKIACEDKNCKFYDIPLETPLTKEDIQTIALKAHDVVYDLFSVFEREEMLEDKMYQDYNQRTSEWFEQNFPFDESDKLAIIIERQLPNGEWEIVSKNGTSEDFELQGELGAAAYYDAMRSVGLDTDNIFKDILYTLVAEADRAAAISKEYGKNINYDIRVAAAEISPPDENGKNHVISIHTHRTNTKEIRADVKKEIYKAEHYNPLEDLTTSRTYPVKTKTTEGTYEGFKVNVGPAVFSLYSTVPSSEDSVLPMIKMEWSSKAVGLPDRVEGLYAQEIEKKALGVLSRSRQVPEEVRQWCRETLVLAEKTKRLLEEYDSFEIPSELGDSYAITSKITDDGKVYACDSKAISIESINIYELTGRLASRSDHVEKYRREEQVLQNFFEHRIAPLYEAESLSREETENYEAFEQMYEAHYKETVPSDFHESKCYVKMEQHAGVKNRPFVPEL